MAPSTPDSPGTPADEVVDAEIVDDTAKVDTTGNAAPPASPVDAEPTPPPPTVPAAPSASSESLPPQVPAAEHAAAGSMPTAESPTAAADLTAPALAPQVVYVHAPVPPRLASNRGVGALLAFVGAIVYGVVLVGASLLIEYATLGTADLGFLGNWDWYIPVVVLAILFILLVLIVNRAGWGAYVFGSLIVGAGVYAGSIGLVILIDWLVFQQAGAFDEFAANGFYIVAAVLAREAVVWFGWFIALRGKRVTARNRERRAAFDQELAEFHANANAA